MRDVEEQGFGAPVHTVATPWRPLRVTALAAMVVCLGLGLVLGRLTSPASSTADGESEPEATLAAEGPSTATEAAPGAAPETEVLGAVETREGTLTAAPVDHLVIVSVSVTACGERAGGTGVLIADDTILTAAHNVGDAGLVRIGYGSQVFTGEVRGVFVDGRDLAIIDLPAPLADPIAAAPPPAAGGAVTVTGFPEGGAQTSVVGPAVDVPDLAAQLWTGPLGGVDAVTRAGMSGGPAVDADGALVGVLVGAQPGTGTAVIATIDDVASILAAPLVDGRCPATA